MEDSSGGDTVFGMEAGRVDGSTAFFIGLQTLLTLYVNLKMSLSIQEHHMLICRPLIPALLTGVQVPENAVELRASRLRAGVV